MAAKEGHAEIISILIEAGAQLEAKADLDVSGLWWVNALCMWRSLDKCPCFAYISGACSHERTRLSIACGHMHSNHVFPFASSLLINVDH